MSQPMITDLASVTVVPTWPVVAATEWNSFVERVAVPNDLTAEAISELRSSCQQILSRCNCPATHGAQRTGLVLGHVQSGKTMSFTGVACLARDNGYKLVIVVTGTSIQLLNQSRTRLLRDLGISGDQTPGHGWAHFAIDSGGPPHYKQIANILKAWDTPGMPPHLRRTVLVTVMKNHSNLDKVTKVLKQVGLSLPHGLAGVPCLIIDDEADQASLNTMVRTGNRSTVYSRIHSLRSALPHHTFLQYTATAQAPLLLNIADLLSPDFCEVLKPGAGYTGGSKFFLEDNNLVEVIPDTELPQVGVPITSPPNTMQRALRLFLLGLSQVIDDPKMPTRSMLVHPSRLQQDHSESERMVRGMLQEWSAILQLPESDPDRKELEELFRIDDADLRRTAQSLRPLSTLMGLLPVAIEQVVVQVVNCAGGAPTDKIEWQGSPGWILIGGQALDRGFTIKGLTVTYMPRDLPTSGEPNADTLQQRARFFGYKSQYLGYCRIFLANDVKDAFVSYVKHEEQLRRSLQRFSGTGLPLRLWRREFMLDASMQPTRRNVIDVMYTRHDLDATPTQLSDPHLDEAALANNRTITAAIFARPGWVDWSPDEKLTKFQTHSKLEIPLEDLCRDFLTQWKTSSPDDADSLNVRLAQTAAMLEANRQATATVVRMSVASPTNRIRSTDIHNSLKNLLQGSNAGSRDGQNGPYPGDSKIIAAKGLTVQIHTLDVTRNDQSILTNVPTLVLASSQRTGWVTQPQGVVRT